MLVDFGKEFKDLDGNKIANIPGKTSTLKEVVIEALLAVFEDEKNLTGDEKLKRWELAKRVKSASGVLELSVEEVALIKKLIGKGYGVLVVGQAFSMLEGKEV